MKNDAIFATEITQKIASIFMTSVAGIKGPWTQKQKQLRVASLQSINYEWDGGMAAHRCGSKACYQYTTVYLPHSD